MTMIGEEGYKRFPCGWCSSCRIDRREMWTDRLVHESLMSKRGSVFLTLTYNQKCLPENRSLCRKDLTNFFKKLRINLHRKYKQDIKIKYYAVGEYGGKFGRPHYHAIITGLNYKLDSQVINDSWRVNGFRAGFCKVKPANHSNIRYTLGYIDKQSSFDKKFFEKKGIESVFGTMSKGIGYSFFQSHFFDIAKAGGYYRKGRLRPMPRYYKTKYKQLYQAYSAPDSRAMRDQELYECRLSGHGDDLLSFRKDKMMFRERWIQNNARVHGKPMDMHNIRMLELSSVRSPEVQKFVTTCTNNMSRQKYLDNQCKYITCTDFTTNDFPIF